MGAAGTAYAGMVTAAFLARAAINMSYVSPAGEHGFDSAYNDLGFSENTGPSGQLYADAGLITNYAFASTTSGTISDTTAGNVARVLGSPEHPRGDRWNAGKPQAAYTYFARSGDVAADGDPAAVTIYPQASSTVYRDDAGTDAITTRYVNTWYSGTVQPYTIMGATDSDPTGDRSGAPTSSSANNMLEVSSDQYDGGSDGGDGNLTESVAELGDLATTVSAGDVPVASTTGSGYLMYTTQSAQARFGATITTSSGSFIAVFWNATDSTWEYDNGTTVASFTPQPTEPPWWRRSISAAR